MPRTLRFRSDPIRLNAEASKPATFVGVAYTGGVMYPSCDDLPSGSPVVVDLDSINIPIQNRPVLDDHDDSTDGVIGETKIMAVRKSDYSIPVEGVLHREKSRTQKILSAKDHRWQLSLGLDSYRLEKIEAGRNVVVNGRTFSGPLHVVRNAYCTDLSIVAVGGDDMTWARISAARNQGSGSERNRVMDKFEDWIEKRFGLKAESLTDDQKAKFQAEYDSQAASIEAARDESESEDETETSSETESTAVKAKRKKPKTRATSTRVVGGDGATSDTTESLRASRNAFVFEARRIATIERICGDDHELCDQAIENDWPIERVRDAVELKSLRAGRATSNGVAVPAGEASAVLTSDTLQAAILLTSGMAEERVAKIFAKRNGERVMNDATSEDFRGMSFQRLFDRAIRATGITPGPNREGKSFLEAARNANSKLKATGFSTLSISYILENVAQKTLLDGWDSTQAKWKEFCAIRSNTNFLPHSRYALDFTGQFRKVNAKGELQHVSMTDSKYTSQVDTFGAVVTLDRQTYINDDMGAFTARLSELGILGAQSVEEAVFVALLGAIGTFFTTGNGNYMSGGATALSIASLAQARSMFLKQVGPNKKPINVDMTKLLVGTLLEDTANAIYTSEYAPHGASTSKVPSKNTFMNRFKPIVSPYLDNTAIKLLDDAGNESAITNQSSTLWFGFGTHGNRSAMSVAFLNGAQSPTVESQTSPDIEILGEQYRAYIDYGVATEDYRLAVCSAGA